MYSLECELVVKGSNMVRDVFVHFYDNLVEFERERCILLRIKGASKFSVRLSELKFVSTVPFGLKGVDISELGGFYDLSLLVVFGFVDSLDVST